MEELEPRVRRDPQLTWIDEGEWRTFFAAGPKSVAETMRFIGSAYARSIDADEDLDQVHKLGDILYLWEDVRRHFPHARAVNLIRDGRAVVNSMIHTPYPYPRYSGEMMAQGDAWKCARLWANDVHVAEQVAQDYPGSVMTVQYEALVAGVQSSLARIGERMNWTEAPSRVFKVADAEKEMHALAGKAPQSSRAGAWRTELSASQMKMIEWRAGRVLVEQGYLAERRRLGTAFSSVVLCYAAHVMLQVRSIGPRLRGLGTVSELRHSVRYRLARRFAQ